MFRITLSAGAARAGRRPAPGLALAAVAALAVAGLAAQAPTAQQVLARLDANASFKSIRYAGRMEITVAGETRVKTMEAVAAGADKAFIEFTNPEDRGVRYLKLGKNLWMYFPKEGDTVKISGHLLKEGMMGSDVSYEDALESADLEARYAVSLKGREAYEGRDCWLLELAAKAAGAPYERRLLWVDAERYVTLKEEMYAKSGKLLKTSRTLAVTKVGSRWFASTVEMESKLRKDTRTLFSMEKLELDPPLDEGRFTMAALTR